MPFNNSLFDICFDTKIYSQKLTKKERIINEFELVNILGEYLPVFFGYTTNKINKKERKTTTKGNKTNQQTNWIERDASDNNETQRKKEKKRVCVYVRTVCVPTTIINVLCLHFY